LRTSEPRGGSSSSSWCSSIGNLTVDVHRIQDGGYQNLKQNYDTIAASNKALREKRTIMILAEGRCIHEKRLRPLKKGTARLALGALEADPSLDEVYIVPVGVNYTHADRADSEVLIRKPHSESLRKWAEPVVDEYDRAFRRLAGLE
jgi:1-acyl-sn-glycerol-3-phosphate acyltransferase